MNDLPVTQNYVLDLSLTVIAGLMLVLFYFQLRNYRRKKVANRKLRELVNEITLRNTTLQHHVATLLEFSKSKVVNFGTTAEALQELAELTADTLQVSRVSIWTYDQEARTLQSVVAYDRTSQKFLDTMILDLSKYPGYEVALKSTRIIDAPDARTHQHTHEFTESYLKPLDIHSMLDVTFSLDGELDGLICCEQQHAQRLWKAEDIIFASSVADITSLAYRSAQRRDYERRIRQQSKEITRMNEMLEHRVRERTAELENRNEQLTEYAFINSHLLRSPVSKILGLINLLEIDQQGDPKVMLNHLKLACDDLDTIVKKITIALDAGDHFNRKVITPTDKNVPKSGSAE